MSNSVNWTDLIPEIHADLPGCPRGLMIQKVRECVIDLCKHTQVWVFQMDPISIVSGTQDYDLITQPNCAVIDTILEARVSNAETTSVVNAGRLLQPGRDYVTTAMKDVFRFVRTPTTAITAAGDTKGLLVKVVLKPERTSTGADDDGFERIWEDWRDAFIFGTKSILQMQPRKTWTDLAQGAENRDRYLRERTKCRIEVNRLSLNLGLRVRARHHTVDNIRGHAGAHI